MRIRSTKPEFWRSRRVASVSWDARLVVKGLESYVDDNGVGKDDLELIVGDVFQRDLVRDPSRTLARVSEALCELSDAGLLWRYEDNGTDLLFIAFWDSIQRIDKPTKGRFRRPDGTWNYKESEIREPSREVRESSRALPPGTGEQGNRGTGEQRPTSSDKSDKTEPPDRFDEFWNTYAHKIGRKKAEAAYRAALKKPGVTADLLISAASAYITWQMSEGKHPQFTKHAATWLHGEHWRDERTPRAAPMSNVQQHLALVQQLGEQPNDFPQLGGPA